MRSPVGKVAVAKKGWWLSWRFWLLRRLTQLSVLGLFLLGPWAGIWWLKGNLSSSTLLDTVPLTDPFVLLQSMATGALPAATALIGAAIVIVIYALLGGRVFCSWVCPVNPVTDFAHWLRRRLKITTSAQVSRQTRYAVLAGALIACAVTGTLVWELVNPVSMLHRGLLFGMGLGWSLILAVLLLDVLLIEHGWCGHLCPMGATYGLLGKLKLWQVTVAHSERCSNCLDCYTVCPERHVLKGPLKAEAGTVAPIASIDCSNCLRCVDVCAEDVFKVSIRLANLAEKGR